MDRLIADDQSSSLPFDSVKYIGKVLASDGNITLYSWLIPLKEATIYNALFLFYEILQKKVRDPRVQGITITDVQMLGDLSMAKVYYTLMSNLASEQEKAQTGLEKAKGTIKRELGHNLKMYKIPDLTFIKDESIEYGNKIDQMLRDLDQK